MTATERRIQLASIDNLAFEFGVCRNTIKNDLLFLTEYMCLTTKQGRGGGVEVESRSRDPTAFTDEEESLLNGLLPHVHGRELEVLQGIIRKVKRRKA